MQVMVMHYAQVVLDQRLHISSITSVEKQQIPSNIHSLRKAIGAAQMAGTVLDSSADYDNHGDLHDTPLPPQTSNGSSMRASQSVQSELARLRMQTEQLSGQCRAQHEELIAARRSVADANGQEPDTARPLQHHLQALCDDLQKTRERGQRDRETLTARVTEVEHLRQQTSALHSSLQGAQNDADQCRAVSQQFTSKLQKEQDMASELQADVSRLKLELQTARATEVQLQQSLAEAAQQLRVQQSEAAAAQMRAETAENDLVAAEAETRDALPQWQEQLQKAEGQLRTLSNQLRDKDNKVREHEAALQKKDVELGTLEMSLADARQSNARTDERLNELQTAHDMLEDAHHKVLAEQNDSDARWQLVTLRAENTDLQQRIIKERDSLQAARDELQELNHKYGAVMLTQSEAENLSAELERARGHLFVQQRCRSEAEQQAIVLRNALDEQKSRAEIAATQAGQAKLQQAESDKIATELKQQLHGWEAELSERDERLAEQAAQIAQLQDLTQPRSTEGQSELHNFVPDLHSTFNTSLPSSAAELDTKQPVPLRHSAEVRGRGNKMVANR